LGAPRIGQGDRRCRRCARPAFQATHLGAIREELAVADAKVKNAAAAVAVIADPRRQAAHSRAVIIPRGEFATWRAVGDHDLNTFLVRADPVGPAATGLQPGMSVWLNPVVNAGQPAP
jgi:hypothetical protein